MMKKALLAGVASCILVLGTGCSIGTYSFVVGTIVDTLGLAETIAALFGITPILPTV